MADKKIVFLDRRDIYCPVGKTDRVCINGSAGGEKKWA